MGPAAAQRGLCRAVIKDPASLPLHSFAASGHAPGEEGIGRSTRALQPCVRRHRAQGWEPRGLGEGVSQRTQPSLDERRSGVGGGPGTSPRPDPEGTDLPPPAILHTYLRPRL